jgi:hypothetical protein
MNEDDKITLNILADNLTELTRQVKRVADLMEQENKRKRGFNCVY